MAAANTTKVYPYKDSDAYVVRNNTDPKFGRTYDTAFDTYWNSFLVVYYPSLQLYVYYGHIVSDLAPESKIDTNKPLGAIREAYNSNNIRSTAIDHLHLSVSPKDVATGWGYSEGALSTDDVKRQGWLDPIEFMRGNGEKLQEYLEEQTNNTIPNSESAATISEEISNPNFLQSVVSRGFFNRSRMK